MRVRFPIALALGALLLFVSVVAFNIMDSDWAQHDKDVISIVFLSSLFLISFSAEWK